MRKEMKQIHASRYKRQIIMRTTTMMMEMNMRPRKAYRHSMSIIPCHFMDINNLRLGGMRQR